MSKQHQTTVEVSVWGQYLWALIKLIQWRNLFWQNWWSGRRKEVQQDQRAEWGSKTWNQGSFWVVRHWQRSTNWLPWAKGEHWRSLIQTQNMVWRYVSLSTSMCTKHVKVCLKWNYQFCLLVFFSVNKGLIKIQTGGNACSWLWSEEGGCFEDS